MSRDSESSFFEVFWRWGRWALLLVVSAWIGAWLAAHLLIVTSELQHADAMVVLAGSSTYRERTHRAAQLFHEGRAPKIILTNDNLKSGWSAERERNPLFVERAMDELKQQGVPVDKIEILPEGVLSTYDEAVKVRGYATKQGLRAILVVTSAYQSRRAQWTFGRVFRGSDIFLGIEPVTPGEQAPQPSAWWRYRLGWELVPGEYLKMIYYQIHYR